MRAGIEVAFLVVWVISYIWNFTLFVRDEILSRTRYSRFVELTMLSLNLLLVIGSINSVMKAFRP